MAKMDWEKHPLARAGKRVTWNKGDKTSLQKWQGERKLDRPVRLETVIRAELAEMLAKQMLEQRKRWGRL